MWTGLTGSASRGAAITPALRDAVLAIEQQAAVAQADFKTSFEETTRSTPLGQAPVLLARLKCAREGDSITLLAMHPLKGQGIEIRLDQTLLHSMLKLLAEAKRAAEWDHDTTIGEPHPTGPLN